MDSKGSVDCQGINLRHRLTAERREWPEHHPGYYGVFLCDLDGHNVEAVYHGD